jgi:hypothetical protein
MECSEQLERPVPAVVGNDLLDERLASQPAADVGVESRARALALLGLVKERRCELGLQLSRADFACSAIFPNAKGSLTARSASTLRSSSIPALWQPATNWL